MIDSERKELRNHHVISRTTIHGWASAIFGLPFLVVGTSIILMSLDIIPVSDEKFHASRKLVAAFGGLFALAGFYLVLHGSLGVVRKIKTQRLRKERPLEPWHADYAWPKREIKGRKFSRIISFIVGFLGMIVFLIPFHWFAFFQKQKVLFVQFAIGFFDFIMLCYLGYVVYIVAQFVKYGTSRLRFGQFPFYLGDDLHAVLMTPKPIPGLKNMQFTLQCIEEKYEIRGTGKNRTLVVVPYQIYAESITQEHQFQSQTQGMQLPISFRLPANNEYVTTLSERPPRYWQLKVKADTPGINYQENFLVPVYKK